jgi:hypothetical protein
MPNTPLTTQQRSNEVSKPSFFSPLTEYFATLNNRLPESLKHSFYAPFLALFTINNRLAIALADYKDTASARS